MQHHTITAKRTGGEMIYRSCESVGEDSCGNTTSFHSSPEEFWTLLVAKVPELLSFRGCHHAHTPPTPGMVL